MNSVFVVAFTWISRHFAKNSSCFILFFEFQCDSFFKMSSNKETWQTTRPTIRARSKFMFNNELLSDVSFVVPVQLDENENKRCKKAIPAHKFVLAISSPVFFAMFYGELAEKSNSIVLPDCEYESLLELFRFVYCDEVKLNEENVMQVLYLAEKYIVPSLVDRCTEYLENIVNVSNAFCVITHAQRYGDKRLAKQCWEMIDKHAEEAVKTEGFETVGRSLLEELVERNSLNIKEVDLFIAVDGWAAKECQRLGMTADGTTKRSVLGDKIVKAIRFPVMTRDDFDGTVLNRKILTPQETFTMVEYYNSVLTAPLEFVQAKRSGLRQQCCRFKSVVLETGNFPYCSYKRDCLFLAVDRDVVLHGVGMFGSQNRKYQVTVTLRDSTNGSVMATKTGKYSSVLMALKDQSGNFYGFDVIFDSPLLLKKGVYYYVKAAMSGPIIWHGKSGVNCIQCPGVKFSFKNHKKNLKTNIREGQFPHFVFSLE